MCSHVEKRCRREGWSSASNPRVEALYLSHFATKKNVPFNLLYLNIEKSVFSNDNMLKKKSIIDVPHNMISRYLHLRQ